MPGGFGNSPFQDGDKVQRRFGSTPKTPPPAGKENRRKELEFHLEEGLERNTWGRIGYPQNGMVQIMTNIGLVGLQFLPT